MDIRNTIASRFTRNKNLTLYTLWGVLFGICFPLGAWAFDFIFIHDLPISWVNLAYIHQSNPLHYIIDTAPLFLGLAFGLAGFERDKLVHLDERLQALSLEASQAVQRRQLLRLGFFNYLALGIILTLIIIAQILVRNSFSDTRDDSVVVNLAGKQRMLSQRLTKVSVLLSMYASLPDTVARYRAEGQQSLALWRRIHRGLQLGDDSLGLPANHNSPEALRLLERITPHFEVLSKSFDLLLDPDTEANQRSYAFREVLLHEELFLVLMNDLTYQYSQEARSKIAQLRVMSLFINLGILLLIVILGLFIFRPLLNRSVFYLQYLADQNIAQKRVNEEMQAQEVELQQTIEYMSALQNELQVQNNDILQSRMQIARNNAYLQSVLDALDESVGIVITDMEGVVVRVNPRFEEVSGYNSTEIVGSGIHILKSDRHEEAFWQEMWQTVIGGNPWRNEVCNRAHDGHLYWVDTVITPIYDEQGRVYQYLSLQTDITKRKTTEQQLRNTLQTLGDAQEIARLGSFEINFKKQEVIWSTLMYSFFELSPTEAAPFGDAYYQYLHPDDLGNFKLAVATLIQEGEINFDHRILTRSGQTRYLLIRATVRKSPKTQKVVYAQGVAYDITDRKLAEERIKEQNQLLDNLLKNLPIILYKAGADGVVNSIAGKGMERISATLEANGQIHLQQLLAQKYERVGRVFEGEQLHFTVKQEDRTYFEHYLFPDAVHEQQLIGFALDTTELELGRRELQAAQKHSQELLDNLLQSINYAKRIQKAVLPPMELFQQSYPDSFLLFRPRDVVSGDFYWYYQQCSRYQNMLGKTVLVVGDCTGHGVPGAFMSLIGIELLQQIVESRQNTSPDMILYGMNEHLLRLLNSEQSNIRDGMDMCVITIDHIENRLEYAGANIPLYLIQDGVLEELKPTKLPIGGQQVEGREHYYEKQSIQFDQPITLYLASDGYQDQFGGPDNRKFMRKQLRDTLQQLHQRPFAEQAQTLNDLLEAWMSQSHQKQIDDITLIGLKVNPKVFE
ncbi:PAS domain S-box protein [Eisenibacter elegans]|uniref:PAS domain S-box protein n=1 Tax=Eisenibacter elegans TaxID=997 RepID=UPI000406F566|nr:PAS domain S-box protein [Eisenibacter elegans]